MHEGASDDAPSIAVTDNNQQFLNDITSFVETNSNILPRVFSALDLLVLNTRLNQHLQSRVGTYGFDPAFHFRITLSANAHTRDIRVNLNPLTLEACDICLQLKIPVDESLQRSLRKVHNETVHNQILKP